MPEYAWRSGRSRGGNVQEIGAELDTIQQTRGGVTPADVVEVARSPDSAMHRCFEWNDSKAATKYRHDQARNLVRSVIVKTEKKPNGAPMFIHTSDEEIGPRYMAASVIVDRPDLIAMARAHAAGYLRTARQRLTEIEELERTANDTDAIELIGEAERKIAG